MTDVKSTNETNSGLSIRAIKKSAKKIKKEKNIPHHKALDEVAVESGFNNWNNMVKEQKKSEDVKKIEKSKGFKKSDIISNEDREYNYIVDAFVRFMVNKFERANWNDGFLNKIHKNILTDEDFKKLRKYYQEMHDPRVKDALVNLDNKQVDIRSYLPIGTWKNVPEKYINTTMSTHLSTSECMSNYKKAAEKNSKLDWSKEMMLDMMSESRSFGYSAECMEKFAQICDMPKDERACLIDKIIDDFAAPVEKPKEKLSHEDLVDLLVKFLGIKVSRALNNSFFLGKIEKHTMTEKDYSELHQIYNNMSVFKNEKDINEVLSHIKNKTLNKENFIKIGDWNGIPREIINNPDFSKLMDHYTRILIDNPRCLIKEIVKEALTFAYSSELLKEMHQFLFLPDDVMQKTAMLTRKFIVDVHSKHDTKIQTSNYVGNKNDDERNFDYIIDAFLVFMANKLKRARENDIFFEKVEKKSLTEEDVSTLAAYYKEMCIPGVKNIIFKKDNITPDNYIRIGTWNTILSKYNKPKELSKTLIYSWLDDLVGWKKKKVGDEDWGYEIVLGIAVENKRFGYSKEVDEKLKEILIYMSKTEINSLINKMLEIFKEASKLNTDKISSGKELLSRIVNFSELKIAKAIINDSFINKIYTKKMTDKDYTDLRACYNSMNSCLEESKLKSAIKAIDDKSVSLTNYIAVGSWIGLPKELVGTTNFDNVLFFYLEAMLKSPRAVLEDIEKELYNFAYSPKIRNELNLLLKSSDSELLKLSKEAYEIAGKIKG